MAQKEYRQTRFRRPAGATEILLVRHGESEPLVPGRPFPLVDGHGDPALAPEGHEQAKRVADRLATQRIDRHLRHDAAPHRADRGAARRPSSASRRTVEPDLREVYLGEWEGELFRQRVAEGHPIAVRMSERGALGRDPRRRAEGRVHRAGCRAGLGRIAAAHPDERVAVFTHGGVIGQLLSLAVGTDRGFAFVGADNGSISHLVLHGDRWILRRFNDTAHLTDGMDLDPEPDLPMS